MDGAQRIRFRDLRTVISRIDRISMLNDCGSYENFRCVANVPDIYDNLFVNGVGIIDSEFAVEDDSRSPSEEHCFDGERFIGRCIEVWVSDVPRVRLSVDSLALHVEAALDEANELMQGEGAGERLEWALGDLDTALMNILAAGKGLL